METSSNNKLRKVCSQCSATVHVRRAVCGCGYAFPRKRRLRAGDVQAKKEERADRLYRANMRASETPQETATRLKRNSARIASMRASETPQETATRMKRNSARIASMRASETPQETATRMKRNSARIASMRASETPEETVDRQKSDKLRKAQKRASETREETGDRQKSDKLRKGQKRALETPGETMQRKQRDNERASCKRSKGVSVEEAIITFDYETRAGPDFVCTCCHRMMYRKTVILCNKTKYTKASPELLGNANLTHISSDGKEWVCKTCDRALARGSMPVQAKANRLQLSEIPPELSGLNALELRLISLRVPFMKMVALPSGKQRSIHGPAVSVPSKVYTTCDVLPRLPSQSELVPMKLKRKVAYRGHYMYDYIRPQKILDALSYLKANNPLYADIDINEQWVEETMANDDELCQYLVEQDDDSMDTECQGDSSGTANVTTSVQNEPMECSNDGDSFQQP